MTRTIPSTQRAMTCDSTADPVVVNKFRVNIR